jgi:hypothetical protein
MSGQTGLILANRTTAPTYNGAVASASPGKSSSWEAERCRKKPKDPDLSRNISPALGRYIDT